MEILLQYLQLDISRRHAAFLQAHVSTMSQVSEHPRYAKVQVRTLPMLLKRSKDFLTISDDISCS